MISCDMVWRKREFILIACLGLVVTLVCAGCQAGQKQPAAKTISKEELRDHLNNFAAESKTILDGAIREIEETSNSKKTQMVCIQMRVKFLQGLNAMLGQDDAVASFVDTWAFSARLRRCFEDGEGARLYDDKSQPVVVAAFKRIEANIESIGRLFLPNGTFDSTQKNIREFAQSNPIQGNYANLILYPSETKNEEAFPLRSIFSIPMAPFHAIEGVDRTATAVNRFTDTAGRFSDILADLPESTRWQLLMLFYELEESETAKSLVSSTASLSDSTAKLAAFSDRLPERIREQTSLLLDEADRKQANLQATLQQAEKVSAAVQNALETVKEASASIDATAKSVTGTAVAWRDAAQATGQIAKDFAQLKPEKEDPNAEPIRIQDIQQTLDKAALAAAEIKQLIGSEAISKLTAILVWRIIELAAAILALVLIYKVIAKKISR